MKTATVSTKGWIVVPKDMRIKYNLMPGSKVQIVDYGGGLAIIPLPEDPISALRGIFAGSPSLTDELLRERKRDKEKEDARTRQ
jgi:AbrB family looped-hinge helix DNA binding protein